MKASNRSGTLRLALIFVTLLSAVGCGGEFRLAPVEGVVTLDGEPLANASVYFQPKRNGESPIVGPPSIGVTDSEGRFEMLTTSQSDGAVVGPHVVSISTFEERMVNPQKSDRTEVVSEELVPSRYRNRSELTFTVPTGGTDNANFQLQTDST